MDGTAVLVTPPAAEPVTLADAKAWARVSAAADDALITAMITAAREHLEQITGRALITQTWDYFCDTFPFYGRRYPYGSPYFTEPRFAYAYPAAELALPWPTLQSVTSIKYNDPTTGNLITLDPSLYTVDALRIPGRVVPSYGNVWPNARAIPNAVQVRFVAGFGAAGANVPNRLIQALKVLIATMYNQRESLAEAALVEIPQVFWTLINQDRVFWL